MSPLLFCMYIDDLLIQLSEYLGPNRVLAYADDLAVIFENKDELSRCINILEAWCGSNYMRLKKEKCGVLFVQNQRGRKKEHVESHKGYPVVQRYKYLGIQLDERMSFKEQLNKYNLEVARRQGVVKGASFLSYSEKYKLWKVLIRSLFLYQSIIYKRLGKTSGEKLRVRYLCSIK